MRDGISVVALAVAAVAVVVALAGFVSRDLAEPPEPPEAALDRARHRLERMERQRLSMREEMGKLRAQLTRAVELGPAGKARKIDMAEVESRVRSVVQAEMTKRLRQKAAQVHAPAPKSTREQKFENMLADIRKNVQIDGNKMLAVKGALLRLRAKLNAIYRAHKAEGQAAQRSALANQARRQTDAELAKVLGPAEFARLDNWRKKSADLYTKGFFGR